MNIVTMVAASSIGVALLIAALSIPLILGKVPMNHFYGIRFRASFKSERNWYAINEYGGKALLMASILILLCGLYGLLLSPRNSDFYLWLDVAVTMVSMLGAFLYSLKKARELERGS